MLPTDIEVWESILPPATSAYLPNNAIIVSRKGTGVARLSGGDYDGDILMFSSDFRLLEILTCTDIEEVWKIENLQKWKSKTKDWQKKVNELIEAVQARVVAGGRDLALADRIVLLCDLGIEAPPQTLETYT
eukprot:5931175-Karenia_brevis.AAC.1